MKSPIAFNQVFETVGIQTGRLNAWAKSRLLRQLSQISVGELALVDGRETLHFGQRSDGFSLAARIDIRGEDFYRDVVFGGTLGAAESYIAGAWECGELATLVRILIRNPAVLLGVDSGWSRLAVPLRKLLHRLNRNTRRGSQRNIGAHYDLGNEFFSLFLDENLMYSCALFEPPNLSLREASEAKLARICAKLELQASDHILEIGTGWGGFALHAAKHYGCRITTTTISENQYQLASERIRAAGLQDQITLLKQDYRELDGQFDKLVSIEMIEAVGYEYYATFFQKCAELIKPDGLMVLQAITIADREFERAKDEVDFIKRYIFPGSCIPSITALLTAATAASDLKLIELDDIGQHYAITLRHWRERFMAALGQVRSQGYSEAFIRLWEFYFAYCEGGFAECALGDVHMILARPLYRRNGVASSTPSREMFF